MILSKMLPNLMFLSQVVLKDHGQEAGVGARKLRDQIDNLEKRRRPNQDHHRLGGVEENIIEKP